MESVALQLRLIVATAIGAGLLTLSACLADPVAPDATAKVFATAISDHDADDLARVLQGTPKQASQVIEATRDFTSDGEAFIGGQADSSLIRCVWVRGQGKEKDSFVAGQLLWEERQERWVVLPGFLPGSSRASGLPCTDPPDEVADLPEFKATTR